MELVQPFNTFGHDWTTFPKGSNARPVGVGTESCFGFSFSSPTSPPFGPSLITLPSRLLRNVLWGLGVCSVFVRSVSPCRLVPEVCLFPSPPALFWPFARRLCPLFSFLLPFRVDPASAGCVCVDHLHRCKTSFCLFCVLVNNFLAIYAGGQWISFHPLPNEDGGLRLWYRDWSSRRTCNFPIYRQWQPAKPSTGMSFKTVSFSALLSQSGILFFLSSVASEPSSEQGRRKHTSNWTSRWINHFLLSDCTGLFVHVRCIPHQ